MNAPTPRGIDAWRPFAEALRRTAPEGTRETVFDGTIGRSSWGGRTLDDGDSNRRHADRSRESRALLRDAVTPLMRSLDRVVGVRLRVTAGGDVRVRLVEVPDQVELSSMSSGLASVLLVPDAVPEPYRRPLVDHRRPLSETVDADAVTAIVGAALPDAQGVPAATLDTIEIDLDRVLPADVRALYLASGSGDLILASADEEDDELFYGLRILGLDDAEGRSYLSPRARSMSFGDGATEVVPTDPAGRVQPLATSPAWFPIGDDWGGNYYVVDLAPGPNGTYGQVLFVDHETLSGARWIAASLTELLTRRPTELAPAGDRTGLSAWDVSDVTEATEVLRLVKRSDAADLGPLAGHSRLRSLEIDPGKATGIDLVCHLPALEYLAVDATTWQSLLDADRVPSGLLCAGFTPRYGDVDTDAQLAVAHTLLTRWNQPTIEVTDLSGSLNTPEPASMSDAGRVPVTGTPIDASNTTAPTIDPPPAPAPQPWWRRIFGP